MDIDFHVAGHAEYQNRFGFPYRTTLSFVPLLRSIEQTINDHEADAPMLNEVIKTIKSIPELNAPVEDLDILKKYRPQVDMLMKTLVPSSLQNDVITGVTIPFLPVTVYGTRRFNETIASDENGIWDVSRLDVKDAIKELIAYVGVTILEKHYGYKIERPDVMRKRAIDKVTGMAGFFKPDIHTGFIEIKVLKEPRPLNEIDLTPLNSNFLDAEFWLRNFPPDTFEINGLIVYRLIDVTDREMISQIEYSMLENDSIISRSGVNDLQDKFRSYFHLPNLRLGLASMFSYMGKMVECDCESWFCIIPSKSMNLIIENFDKSVYKKALDAKAPVIIADLNKIEATVVERALIQQGVSSMIISPIFNNDDLIGMLELTSENKNAFNFISILKLKTILPVISMVMQRSAREYHNRIQSIIKENFTSIHPAVEWKFVNAAIQQIKESTKENPPAAAPITLENVIPIYGQIDIRSSSDRRNEAIRLDIIDYLLTAITILKEANDKISFTLIDEIIFKGEKFLEKLKNSIDSGDETGILEFLKSEVASVLNIVAERVPELQKSAYNFIAALEPDHEHYHMRRRNFDQSLSLINDSMAEILEDEEVRTQKMLPHYFEKYKTDGVEYNIYLGQSILQNGKFNDVYVRNFRLWQLISMVNIAREIKTILPLLSVPLETTQLILCYSNPFSIIFRMDEKRFDVAGAYNIRYEILKKRIDKAHINGTTERITQPGTIAIIYTQEKEAREYEHYFEYLRAREYIYGKVEYLEVEPLQGIQGLKALRVQINYEPGEPKLSWQEEELLKEVKGIVA